MDQQAFDRLARLLGGAATRRGGLRAALGATVGAVFGTASLAGDSAAREGSGGKDRGSGKDNNSGNNSNNSGTDKGKGGGSGDGPRIEGPCGNGKRKDNICTSDVDCCTGICNLKVGKRNRDGQGRCRCMKRNKSCNVDSNCCNILTCNQGRCSLPTPGPGPTPASPIPTGSPCTPVDTCSDPQATCTSYLSGNPPGSYCLLANGGACSAANDCVGQSCSGGVCASGSIPTGKACTQSDVCADGNATCTQYTSSDPSGTYCLLADGGTCDAGDQCVNQSCVNDACTNVPEICDVCPTCTYQTVQAAVDGVADGATIRIDEGSYTESLVIDKNLTLRACNLAAVTILNAAEGDRVIRRANLDSAVSLKIVGITIERNSNFPSGGGISGWFDLSLSGTTIVRNGFSENVGAGVELGSGDFESWEDEDGYWNSNNGTVGKCTLILEGRAQITNSQSFWNGGAVWMGCVDGQVIVRGSASITSCASGEDGGAIWAADGITVTLEDSAYIGGNYASDDGGGIFADERVSVVMKNGSYITANRAADDGGGVSLDSYSDLTMFDASVIAGNTSDWNGGGVMHQGCPAQSVTMSGTAAIRDNTSKYRGGGVYLGYGIDPDYNDGDSIELVLKDQARISGNLTTDSYDDASSPGFGGGGGGAYIGQYINVILSGDASIADNRTARWGGGVFAEGDVTLKGTSAISDNTAKETGGGVFLYGESEDVDWTPTPIKLKVAGTAKMTGNKPDRCNSVGLAFC
jgi:hypothetical protein